MSKACVNHLNQNNMHPNEFMLSIPKLPEVTYFAQTVLLPGLSIAEVPVPTAVRDYPVPGEKLNYEPLIITFPVNEDMSNYKSIQDWMYEIADSEAMQNRTSGDITNLLSDANLIILDNNKNKLASLIFEGMFPTSLTEIQFDVSAGSVPIIATASFSYTRFYVE